MRVWRATFNGRPIGAVGVARPIVCLVYSDTEGGARTYLTDRYDVGFMSLTLKELPIFRLFLQGYCLGLIFTASNGNDDGPLPFPIPPGGSREDAYPDTTRTVRDAVTMSEWAGIEKDCLTFFTQHIETNEDVELERVEEAGIDFHYTRNGHGCGFWDGDWPDDLGQKLTEATEPYGSLELFGEPGNVYVTH